MSIVFEQVTIVVDKEKGGEMTDKKKLQMGVISPV